MNTHETGQIVFEVETSRVLEILSKEIYDSPLALLRENVQNAYDAILMRSSLENRSLADGAIQIEIVGSTLTITDNGIGMTEEVLRTNFWKAGSSGKRTELAYRSGVIGTFGIGAMANFGVATVLTVETRAVGSEETLVSVAERAKLSIARECISLIRQKDERPAGTRLIVQLEPDCPLTEASAREYLRPYVRFLPVAVTLNGSLISQQSLTDRFNERAKGTEPLQTKRAQLGNYAATVEPFVDGNGVLFARVHSITLGGKSIPGELALVQQNGELMALRNYFGLAPVPVSGHYQFCGIVNLGILQPTAGREALSRESIEHIHRLVALTEATISEIVADCEKIADRNTGFQQYVLTSGRVELAKNVTVRVLPSDENVAMGRISEYCSGRTCHFYTGRDQTILHTFASEQSFLLNVSEVKPRRQLQLQYISRLGIPQVPDHATIIKEFSGPELTLEEASLAVRTVTTLAEDYLLPNSEVRFAQISHGVTILAQKPSDVVMIYIARDSAAVAAVVKCYWTAREVFDGFVKDFVRNHLYTRISQFIPSTTREGADALYRVLQRNRELYRYEESDFGALEPLLADLLSGNATLGDVIKTARRIGRPQADSVRVDQVGTVEQELPGVVDSPAETDNAETNQGREYEPAPPIMRSDLACEMKILSTGTKYAQLNGFSLFLGLSDRLFKIEGDFFREPHTTRVIWAGHRVIYVFGHASTTLTLYYDIELKEPLGEKTANGMMIPTTTIFTKNRIFVPIPDQLLADFKITEGAKEFFVRFDTLVG